MANKQSLSTPTLEELREELIALLVQERMRARSGTPSTTEGTGQPVGPHDNKRRSSLPPLIPQQRPAVLPLSFAQERLWVLEQVEPLGGAYTISAAVRVSGVLEVAALESAFAAIVERHESLRTRFENRSGKAVQVIDPEALVIVEKLDLSARAEAARKTEVERQSKELAAMTFDLATGPLLRVRLLAVAETEFVLLLAMHHIISDGWSMEVMIKEIASFYISFALDQPVALAPLPVQYADFALWQRDWLQGDALEQQRDYWRKQMDGAPAVLQLPADHARPPAQSFRGARYPVVIPVELSNSLNRLARTEGVTPFMLLLAAFQLLLGRWSGQQDVVVGAPIANRTEAAAEDLIGFFTNTLALRTELPAEITFRALLQRVCQTTLGAYAHQDLPFEQLVEMLQPARALSRHPVFQAMFVLQNIPQQSLQLPGLRLHLLEDESNTSKFDLTLSLTETPTGFRGHLEYAADLFEATTIGTLAQHFLRLLEEVIADPDQRIGWIALLSENERKQVLYTWNATEAEYPQDTCIHELFEEQVRRAPDAVAVLYENASLTYEELNQRANRLAHYLRKQGVKPDHRVAICLHRSLEMVIALMAVLKAGAAYVPLDPSYPTERLGYMLDDSMPVAILTQSTLRNLVDDDFGDVSLLELDNDGARWENERVDNLASAEVGLKSSHLAYVIYTSGSTGQPKGVMNEHGAVVNRLEWMQQAYGLNREDAVLQKTPFSFDVSVWEFFWPLLYGAKLVMARPGGHRDPDYLATLIREQQITTVHFVPSMLQLFLEFLSDENPNPCPSLLRVICSGEALPSNLARRVQRQLSSAKLYNLYGPTEAAVDVTAWTCSAEWTKESVPIGRPIANTRIYILDEQREPVPIGVTGEIYIGGVQVARGYLNRPELTAERFIANPFVAGDRLYKTGDLGRFLNDGNIVYLGRNDDQVKIRGFRIELGEIEARLSELPGVREAAVVASEDALGEKRLVGYYTTGAKASEVVDIRGLKAHLLAHLPDHMVPAAFVRLEKLPLTANGKLDRRALPEPGHDDFGRRAYEEPQEGTETVLAQIWSELLKTERVSRHENFFVAGGQSILAVQLVSRIRARLGYDVGVKSVFENPVLHRLAAVLDQSERKKKNLPVALARDGALPLSFVQERLWVIQERDGDNAYNMHAALNLDGPIVVAALKIALRRLVERHEPLRTRFVMSPETAEPEQHIDPEGQIAFAVRDVREDEIDPLVRQHADQIFDLSRGPLFKVLLLGLAPERHVLSLVLHHIIADGWSLAVITRDMQALYEAALQQQPSDLPPLVIQYADYAAWQRRQDMDKPQTYWTSALAGYKESLNLASDMPRRRVRPGRADFVTRTLPTELTEALGRFSHERNASLFMVLLSGLALLAYRQTRCTDMCIGTTVAGREQLELEPLIGFFINILPLRISLSEHLTGEQLLEQVKRVVLDGLEHQALPFEHLLTVVPEFREQDRGAVLPVMLRHQNFPEADVQHWSGGLKARKFQVEQIYRAKCDLDLQYFGDANALTVIVEFDSDRFKAERVMALLTLMESLLAQIIEAPHVPLSRLLELTAEEQALLNFWNGTGRRFENASVTELFAQQVAMRPGDLACLCGDQALSFTELNRRSDNLARVLMEHGAGEDVRVALYLARGVDFLTALLAVLKTGSVYVPVDPSYPNSYAKRILDDAQPAIVLADRNIDTQTLPESATTLRVDKALLGRGGKPLHKHPPAKPGDLASIAYTSGSTGQPKGVCVDHRQLLNCLQSLWAQIPFEPDEVVAQKTPSTFVVSLKEMLASLLVGVPQVIVPDLVVKDSQAFAAELQRHRVTRLNLVPSHLVALLDYSEALVGLRHVITAGEPLSQQLRQRFEQLLPETRLYNNYGCTELNDIAYCMPGEQSSASTLVPIGRPIHNVRLHVMDEQMRMVPIGVTGELYVEGDSVGRGYWNRPTLSAERFLANSFTQSGPVLFRTGDRVRRLADGRLEFLGREDFQIKIRGQRIDLPQVEQALADYPEIAACAVTGFAGGTEQAQLVAYYVADPSVGPDHNELHAWLSELLPAYMVPSRFIRLDALPTLPNGKLDRLSLPQPDPGSWSFRQHRAPQTDTERIIAQIWSELLNLPIGHIGLDDNFFACGGNSIGAARLKTRLGEQLGYEVSLTEIFENPILSKLSAILDASGTKAGGDRPVALPRDRPFPVTDFQSAQWRVHERDPASPHNLGAVLALDGPLSLGALESALNDLVERHEILRTRFVVRPGTDELQQIIYTAIRMPLLVRDVQTEDVPQCISEHAGQIFDLEGGPLFNVLLLRLGAEKHVVSLVLHHILADAWSLRVLAHDMRSLYAARLYQEPSGLPPLIVQYADYAAWIRSQDPGGHRAYWTSALANYGKPIEQVPDNPSRLSGPQRAAKLTRTIPADIASAIGNFGNEHSASLFMVLLSGLALLVHQETQQYDLCFATLNGGRQHSELELLIGGFVNLLPLMFKLSSEITAEDLLAQVKQVVLSAIAHQPYPWPITASPEGGNRSPLPTPSIWVRHENYPEVGIESWAGGLRARSMPLDAEYSLKTITDLDLQFYGGTNGLTVVAVFAADRFDEDRVNALLLRLEEILARMIEVPQLTLRQLLESIPEEHR